MDMAATTADVLAAFEDRLTNAAGLDLQLMDRIDLPAGVTSHRTARGIFVDVPGTTNTGEYRDQDVERVEEQVIVILFFRLNAKGQKSSRRDALLLSDEIRVLLVDRAFRPEWHIDHVSTARGSDPASSEVYRITHTFSLTRDDSLGG